MGCISSKEAVRAVKASSPVLHDNNKHNDSAMSLKIQSGPLNLERNYSFSKKKEGERSAESRSREIRKTKKEASHSRGSFSFRLGFSQRYVQAEQTAAGWPHWLSSAASEAVDGWVPLRADSFEKLEKIGQGTYSSVFRARQIETGKMVALKKVRVDNFQPESIRFMAREIMILRRLDHPNIIKLEGLITSRLSNSIYLVFEYMEHDLAGLVSNPDIKFSEAQVKCYMTQLLCGVEHCHLRVDLWSVGCVFAEILMGKPILKGRTEVEQLHKIFKLCGSPPDEFWKKSKLPQAAMFKPLHNYESSLREKCKEFPKTAVNLIEILLSIDPQKRGTASSALMSEYFNTKPFACDPSSFPKYPPSKEIDAKNREDGQRKKTGAKMREPAASKKPRRVRKNLQETNSLTKLASKEEKQEYLQLDHRNSDRSHIPKGKGTSMRGEPLKPSFDTMSETSQVMNTSQGDSTYSGPSEVAAPSGFTWAKRRKEVFAASTISDGSKSKISALDPSFAKTSYSTKKGNEDLLSKVLTKHAIQKQQRHPDSFDTSELFRSHDMSMAFSEKEEPDASKTNKSTKSRSERVEFSGPLPNKIDELLQKNESQIRRAGRRSRFERD
ncbi:hypothetical protein ACB094_01G290600 [Castanea mollissima]